MKGGSILPFFIVGAALAASSFLAFSPKVRQEIRARDKTCQGPGPHEGYLQAAHTPSHDRNPIMIRGELIGYDDARRGLLLCLACHLRQHIVTEGRNGLNRAQNEWSINMLRERLLDYRKNYENLR